MTHNEDTITAAIRAEKVIHFIYPAQKRGRYPVLRTVSPYELSEDGQTFLGWCHDREALRRFNLNKIQGEVRPTSTDAEYVQPAT